MAEATGPYAQASPTPVTPPATMPKGDGGQPATGTTSRPTSQSEPHAHGCPVEQIHRVWTTDQGVDAWVLAEEVLHFVQTWENRRCTCVGRPPRRPDGVPSTAVYDPDSGLWRPAPSAPSGGAS